MNEINSMRRHLHLTGGLLLLGSLAACGGTSGGTSLDPGLPGDTVAKPGGSGGFDGDDFYIIDPNESGDAQALLLEQTVWGRLVDIYDTVPDDVDPDLFTSRLIFADFLIGPDVGVDTAVDDPRWVLSTNQVTGQEILRIKAQIDGTDSDFEQFLGEATESLVEIDPASLAANEIPPFPLVARNAALSMQFNDLLDEDTIELQSTIEVLVGTPPTLPFDARLFADRNRGGIAPDGAFRSTRVIVDFTISESELSTIDQVVQVNGVGLPEGLNPNTPNFAIRIPSQISPVNGLFETLTNLKGKSLNPFDNEKADFQSPTVDIVRAMRTAGPADPEGGFLVDNVPPRVLGIQPIAITSVAVDPDGGARDFLVTYNFNDGSCATDAAIGDVLQFPAFVLEVTEVNPIVGALATETKVSLPTDFDIALLDEAFELVQLTGTLAQYTTPWRDELPAGQAPCFIRFSPSAAGALASEVQPESQILVRFSEAIAPESVSAFETFFIGKRSGLDTLSDQDISANSAVPSIEDLVLGRVLTSPNARDFRFAPSLPFEHEAGDSESYFFNILSEFSEGVVDLSGNTLGTPLPEIEFTLDPLAPEEDTSGWALRFNRLDQDQQDGPDIAGQYIYDAANRRIIPRTVERFGALVDRNQPLVSGFTAPVGGVGLNEPLVSAGSKLQHVWRYSDAGFKVTQKDGFFYDLDIEGVSWSPLSGQVVTTVFDEFEMRVGHSQNLFDELYDPLTNAVIFPASGFGANASFDENYLEDDATIVSERDRGFVLSPSSVFQASSGIALAPMPWNRGVEADEKVYWTWRDTSIVDRGAIDGGGTPLAIGAPTFNEAALLVAPEDNIFDQDPIFRLPGDVYSFGLTAAGDGEVPPGVPTTGLPILLEYRCYPSEESSVNLFDFGDILPAAGALLTTPSTRAHSTGGVDLGGNLVIRDPDLESTPQGGFVGNYQPPPAGTGVPPNPEVAAGTPPGTPTPARDNLHLIGQMDVVLRVSRVHTVVIDSENLPGEFIGTALPGSGFTTATYEPDYGIPIVEPSPTEQPVGTSITFAYRGTDRARLLTTNDEILDGSLLDVYGDVAPGPITTLDPDSGAIIPNDGLTAELFNFNTGESGSSIWRDTVDGVDGLRFVQTRITFISNPITNLSPTLSTFGLPFRR